VNPAAGVVLGGFLLAVPVVVRRLAAEPELPGPAAVILLTEQLAARLSSGGSLLQALESVDPRRRSLTADLERLRAHVRRGASLQRELDTWAAGADVRLGVPLLVDALALAGSTGGSQASALERVAATLRDRQALSQEIDAQASLAKASAAVLVVLPVAFSALLCIMDSQVRHSFTSVIGAACLVAGTAADLVGARWMRRIIRSAS
jgi:tight adherence protein B